MSSAFHPDCSGIESDTQTHSFFTPLPSLIFPLSILFYSLPSELVGLTNLVELDLSNNELDGSIPSAFNGQHFERLKLLFLQENKLSGEIPSSLTSMGSLHDIDLSYNRLTGTVPASINELSNARIIKMDHNVLEGRIPDLSNLQRLQLLHLNDNELSGDATPLLQGQVESLGM